MSFRIDHEKLLEKYKTIWPQTEDLKNNVFLVYYDRYIKTKKKNIYYDRSIKTKKRTYSDKAYINFYGLNAPENYIECKSFTVVSIYSFLTYQNKYYPQLSLYNQTYKIAGKQMLDYRHKSPFENDEDQFFINRSQKCCITMELI